ncbi:hypothetical protein V7024_03410 [Bacillus sp. JJ864]|uniref:hypothetical protein n=1 Tax=Bacillus sp. JJ864 TaxID=3122975 RepID=UPI003000FA7D
MKNMRNLLSGWIVLQLLIYFPVYGKAEVIEQIPAVKQDNHTLVKEYSVNTEIGYVTVNTKKAIVGETIHIAIKPKKLGGQTLIGCLQLLKTEQQVGQERQLAFTYDVEKQLWTTSYTVTPYDLEGDWQLDLLMNGDKEPVEQNVDLVHIENKEPLPDKEGPKVEEFLVQDHLENAFEMKKGELLNIRVKAKDAESSVKQVVIRLEDKETNFTVPLQYEKKEGIWIGKYEISDGIPTGTYKAMIELIDGAGNKSFMESKYVISVVAESKKEEITNPPKDKAEEQGKKEEGEAATPSKEAIITITEPIKSVTQNQDEMTSDQGVTMKSKEKLNTPHDQEAAEQQKKHVDEKKKQQTGVQSSDLFAIISGGFLLFFILKSNKEWGL